MGDERPIALVTGVCGGIGRAIAAALHARGYHVVGSDLTEGDAGPAESFQAFDLSDLDAIEGFVSAVENDVGPIAVMVNNAAYFSDRAFADLTPEDIMRTLTVNVGAVMLLCRTVGDRMAQRGGGAIVNMSSIAGKRGSTQADYGASKEGVINLTRTLSRIYAPANVRINAVAPALVDAGMGDRLGEDVRESYVQRTPMGRGARAEEIASVVAFLAGPDASYMTGETVNVDGGL